MYVHIEVICGSKPCTINKHIMCNYNGRQFRFCGKFKFMPKTEGMKNFPSLKYLNEIPIASGDSLFLHHCLQVMNLMN